MFNTQISDLRQLEQEAQKEVSDQQLKKSNEITSNHMPIT